MEKIDELRKEYDNIHPKEDKTKYTYGYNNYQDWLETQLLLAREKLSVPLNPVIERLANLRRT